MHVPTTCLIAPPAVRAQLAGIAKHGRTPQTRALRVRAVLGLIDRQRPRHIASKLGVSRNQVYLWTKRYLTGGLSAVMTDCDPQIF